jgi:hypothetical protein
MLVVVGGQSRNIGKTAVVAGLIRKLRGRKWTALKITQYGHGLCSNGGHACECGPDPEHPFALTEEYEAGRTDTGRYLAAGANRAFWLRTPTGRLFEAADLVRKIVDQSADTIIESNSILEFFDPDVFLMVLDFGCDDFKASSLKFLDRASAFLVIDQGLNAPLWDDIAKGLWEDTPRFLVKPPAYVNAAVAEFVKSRLSGLPAESRSR